MEEIVKGKVGEIKNREKVTKGGNKCHEKRCPRLILKRVFDESVRHWRRLRYLELPCVSNHEKGNTVVKIRSPDETNPLLDCFSG